ncbi:hypothetical protein [Actinomadura fibrosa]|uniref:Uncharacterized protein n=1 Tax=Actinomadura fibrosa TaxID=111802 RepID=A0ABW2XK33_9ACTN|nr:hypothetical protein [Actinomadura fibrosa]
MEPVLVELKAPTPTPPEDEVVYIDDLDAFAEAAANMGCGDDNPYR